MTADVPDSPTVVVETGDPAVVVRLRRPPANAMSLELIDELNDVTAALAADPPPAVVLTGTDDFFCAGADLRLVPDLDAGDMARLARGVSRLFAQWHHFPAPVVSAVNGHAVAGGFVLALCGDRRIAATSGQYGLTEVKVGIPYPSTAMAVVRQELHPPVARRLVLGGELLDSTTMVELGAFDEVVADDHVLDRAMEAAAALAAHPAHTYRLVKERLRALDLSGGDRGGAAAAVDAVADARVAARRVLDRD